MFFDLTQGIGYPWGTETLPLQSAADYSVLDTNNDSAINSNDDPYLPYYPGDDFVDWVGMNTYYIDPNKLVRDQKIISHKNPKLVIKGLRHVAKQRSYVLPMSNRS